MSVVDDEARFSALYRPHYAEIVRFAARRIGPDRARDVAAETFLVVWRRLDDAPDHVLPWLYSIARNVLANEQRGDRRRLRLSARLRSMRSCSPDGADPAGGLEDVGLREALAALSARDQETLTLVAWEGLDLTAAAAVVGCSPKTFAVRLHRARQRLDRALGESARPARLEVKETPS
jgi:RNA polymerase sigma-70 factor (ECF subfamily)